MRPAADTRNRKVRDLEARLAELECERTELEFRRERLGLPAMDREFLRRTLDDFETAMASEENPKKLAPVVGFEPTTK